jgi:hypothetical protein
MIGGLSATVALFGALAIFWWGFDGAAEMLSWRGALARSARDAEQAYASIASQHPGSRQREFALLKLAQLQIAKGDAGGALRSLDMLHRDYPAGAQSGERQYWMARALLAGADTVRACAITKTVRGDAADALGPDFSSLSKECGAFDARTQAADSVQSANGAVFDSSDHSVRPAGSPVRRDSLP